MWGQDLKAQRAIKTQTDSCKTRDLWVTDFVILQNINKIALSFTSKEIGKFWRKEILILTIYHFNEIAF